MLFGLCITKLCGECVSLAGVEIPGFVPKGHCCAGWRLSCSSVKCRATDSTLLPASQTHRNVSVKSIASSLWGEKDLPYKWNCYQDVLFISSLDPLMKVSVYLMDGDLWIAICKSTSKHTQTLNEHRCTNEIMKLPNNSTACTWELMGGTDFSHL